MICTNFSIYSGLGAGVCSMLGLLWNARNIFPTSKFSCYSFASPLIVGYKAMKDSIKYKNMISVAVSTDIVTRLSIEGLLKMHCRILQIEKDSEKNKFLIENIIKTRCSTNDYNQFIHKLGDDEKELVNELKSGQKHDIREELYLYPCGKLYYFIPEFLLNERIENKDKYRHLLNLIEFQCETNTFIQTLQFIYKIICDFYVFDKNEILTTIKESGKDDMDSIMSLDRFEIDRFEFTQMIYNGNESLQAHFPGRYTNGFNIDIFDIFAMSKFYDKLYGIKYIPSFLITISIFIIVIIIYIIKICLQLLYNLLSPIFT